MTLDLCPLRDTEAEEMAAGETPVKARVSAKTGEVWYFIREHVSERSSGMGGVGSMGEGVTADAAGNIIAGEVGPVQGLTKFIPRLIPVSESSTRVAEESKDRNWIFAAIGGLLVGGLATAGLMRRG